jgi:hypothetical protein
LSSTAATYKKFFIMRLVILLSASVLCSVWVSCEKAVEEPVLLKKHANTQMNIAKSKLLYGETIFYLDNDRSKNTIRPVNVPNVSGYFKSIPNGLALDTTTGAIDISQSLTGLAYKIFYVSTAGKLVDSTRFIVSGIDYEDGMYELGAKKEAQPYYNANKAMKLTTVQSDFDETDLNGDGVADVAPVTNKNLVINKKTGSIDLEKSIRKGLLGKNPKNGATADFTIYYRVKDGSKGSINKLEVRIVYFKKKNLVSSTLTDILNTRDRIDSRVNKMPTPGFTSETDLGGTTNDPLGDLDAFGKPRRPPLIIIIE